MEPDRRRILSQLLAEAIEQVSDEHGHHRNRDAAVAYVAKLEDLERFGQPWVRAELHRLTIVGAITEVRDAKRNRRVKIAQPTMANPSGSVVLGGFAGVRIGPDYEQMSLDMGAAELASYIRLKSRTAKTLTDQLALLARVQQVLADGRAVTVGDALAFLGVTAEELAS